MERGRKRYFLLVDEENLSRLYFFKGGRAAGRGRAGRGEFYTSGDRAGRRGQNRLSKAIRFQGETGGGGGGGGGERGSKGIRRYDVFSCLPPFLAAAAAMEKRISSPSPSFFPGDLEMRAAEEEEEEEEEEEKGSFASFHRVRRQCLFSSVSRIFPKRGKERLFNHRRYEAKA